MNSDTARAWWAAPVVIAAVVLAVVTGPAVAAAGPSATPVPGHGSPVCQVRDSRLTEISGMVAIDDGFVVVNDSADEEPRRRIFFLDSGCAVVRTVRYPLRPRDTEDLAIGVDGTIWVADIGDNNRSRQTIAVWTLAPGADRPVLHRMTYPDGPHDAEALLLTGDGRPVIVTKQGGDAGLYAPTTPLRPQATAPLAKVGQVRLPITTTSNPFSFLGRAVVTGGATAPDERRVVLRTYADAFEYDIPGGDVVSALTTGIPRITPLPDEPQGESITYSRDGRSLLTVSETADQPAGTRPTILRYTPTQAAPAAGRPDPTPTAAPTTDHVDVGTVTSVITGAGAVGLGLVVTGLIGITCARRAHRARR